MVQPCTVEEAQGHGTEAHRSATSRPSLLFPLFLVTNMSWLLIKVKMVNKIIYGSTRSMNQGNALNVAVRGKFHKS